MNAAVQFVLAHAFVVFSQRLVRFITRPCLLKINGSVNRTAPSKQAHYGLSQESRHGDAPEKGASASALLSPVSSDPKAGNSGLFAETPKF